MVYRAIYTYAWDVAEAGIPAAVDRFLAIGLDGHDLRQLPYAARITGSATRACGGSHRNVR
jgi:hypothetical protein